MLFIVNLVFSKSSDALCYMYLFKFHIVLPPAADILSLSLSHCFYDLQYT